MKKAYLLSLIGLPIAFLLDNFFMRLDIRTEILDIMFNWITHFGSLFAILVFMTSLFLWEEKKQSYIPILWLSFVITIVVCFFLKFLIARPRPILVYYPLINLINYSFPSMHAAGAFSVVALLDKEFPTFKWFWCSFAVLVAFSRVYFKLHYFSDIYAGALLGYTIGYLILNKDLKTLLN